MDENNRHTGRVARYGDRYGFIRADINGDVVFVHKDAVRDAGLDALYEGDRVEYSLVLHRNTGRTKADRIKLIGGSEQTYIREF